MKKVKGLVLLGSIRRAALRRDKKKREKILKNKSPQAKMLQAKNKGYDEGKLIATSVFLETAVIDYGWGTEKIKEATDFIATTSMNSSSEVVNFVANIWNKKLVDRIQEYDQKKIVLNVDSIEDNIMYEERNQTYFACCSLVLSALYSNYGFSTNSKQTGKLDKIMNRFVIRFYQMMESPKYYTGEKCMQRVEEVTGIKFE